MFEESINEVFLNPQKYTVKSVYERTTTKIDRINEGVPADQRIKPPSERTIYRWMKDLYYALVKGARG